MVCFNLSRTFFKTHQHGQPDSNAQMDINKLSQILCGCLCILLTLNLIGIYLKFRREQQELKEIKKIPDIKSRSRTAQDILQEYKNNPSHKYLPRSERRFREHQLERHLKHNWSHSSHSSQGRSRSHTQGAEPVKETVSEVSRMNRQHQQRCQPLPQKSHILHLLHLLFYKLCIYTALPFLTLSVFCRNLRITLIESRLLQVEEESDGELCELDPV